MADMKKWIDIMQSLLSDRDVITVDIDQDEGGGVGDIRSVDDELSTVEVGLKGDPSDFKDVPMDSISPAIDPRMSHDLIGHSDQRYDEIDGGDHCLNDKPELQAGELVRVDDMYGSGSGEGYARFVAYALSGDSAIVNIDGRDKSVPIESVTIAPEAMLDKFSKEVNDGALSPLSFGDENKTEIEPAGDDSMDDLERFLGIVQEAEDDDFSEKKEVGIEEEGCGCMEYDCEACFPNMNEVCNNHGSDDELEEVAVIRGNDDFDVEEVEELDELSPVISALATGAASELTKKATGPSGEEPPMDDSGDGVSEEPVDPMTIDGPNQGVESSADDIDMNSEPGINNATEDPGELIAAIMYSQDQGISGSDRIYDENSLINLPLENLKRVHDVVTKPTTDDATDLADLRESLFHHIPDITQKPSSDDEFSKWMDIVNKNL